MASAEGSWNSEGESLWVMMAAAGGSCDEGCLVLGRRSGEEMAGSGKRIQEGRCVAERENDGSMEGDASRGG